MVRTLSSTELPEAQKEVKSWVPNKSGKACWIFRDQWDTENNWHKNVEMDFVVCQYPL